MSNFDVADLDEVWKIVGSDPLACNLYHLQEHAIEHAVLAWCEAHDVAVIAYSPFGSGRFPGPRTKGGLLLRAIAAAHGATLREVALRFLVRKPGLFAIPKARSPSTPPRTPEPATSSRPNPSSSGSTPPSRAAHAATSFRCCRGSPLSR